MPRVGRDSRWVASSRVSQRSRSKSPVPGRHTRHSPAPAATAAREELLERAREGRGIDYSTAADEIERAAACFEEVLRIRLETIGAEDAVTPATMRNVLELAVPTPRWTEVSAPGREYYDAHVAFLGSEHAETRRCAELLLEGHEQHGDEEQAATWREVLASLDG